MAKATQLLLARAVCSIAASAGMPDSYWETDSRIELARQVLGAEEVERWERGELEWESED
jgi:hypothetical protein